MEDALSYNSRSRTTTNHGIFTSVSRLFVILFVLGAFSWTVSGQDPCVCLRKHIGGLFRPLFLTHAVDTGDIDRFFVLENDGKILEFPSQSGEDVLQPYLDISDRVARRTVSEFAIGLLGLALHPNFAQNWRIYVFYTSRKSGQLFGVISEFKTHTKYHSDPNSEKILLQIPLPSSEDLGGHLFFGYDGYLYISVGHGGVEHEDFAQNNSSLLGKILRIDVEIRSQGLNYSIPPDNPLAASSGQERKEIYASGARNMWRCSLDSGDVFTGEGRERIFCGDVGKQSYEEVNIIQKGGNYGWNIKEGYECRQGKACENLESEVLPISVYDNTLHRGAIIGGYVYRGRKMATLQGQYIFGDAVSGEFFRLVEPNGTYSKWISHLLTVCPTHECPCEAREEKPIRITSFSTDKYGELYVLTTTSLVGQNTKGDIYQLAPPVRNVNDVATCGGHKAKWSGLTEVILLIALLSTKL